MDFFMKFQKCSQMFEKKRFFKVSGFLGKFYLSKSGGVSSADTDSVIRFFGNKILNFCHHLQVWENFKNGKKNLSSS